MDYLEFNIEDETDYIPESYGNREKYVNGELKNPIIVTVDTLTMKDSESFAGQIITTTRPGFRNQTQDNSVQIGKKQFSKCIKRIQNLSVNGKKIETASDLWNSKLQELCTEMMQVINGVSMLTEGDAKNLRPQSIGSSEKETDGIAVPA
tara:strand:- start:1510 stop:1959 length:450 start_codon:yes stop_codon:yes gene_type:complete